MLSGHQSSSLVNKLLLSSGEFMSDVPVPAYIVEGYFYLPPKPYCCDNPDSRGNNYYRAGSFPQYLANRDAANVFSAKFRAHTAEFTSCGGKMGTYVIVHHFYLLTRKESRISRLLSVLHFWTSD